MPPDASIERREGAVEVVAVDQAAEAFKIRWRIVQISKTLGVTEDAAKKLLKIVGEDPNIPEDKLAEALSKVAADYQRLQVQVAALNPDNPTAKALVERGQTSRSTPGIFSERVSLLRQADAGPDHGGAGGAQARGAGAGRRRSPKCLARRVRRPLRATSR